MPWADDAAARLAVLSGSTAAAIKNALPAFGTSRGQVCLRRGIWLFQAAAYPENIAAAACARETSGRGEKGNKPAGRHEGGSVKRDLPHAIRPGCAGVRRTCRFV